VTVIAVVKEADGVCVLLRTFWVINLGNVLSTIEAPGSWGV